MIPKTFSSKFLTIKDVKEGDLLKFIDEGEEVESAKFKNVDGSPKNVFQIGVQLANGEEKVLSLNGTSYRNIANFYGADTEKWLGKEARVNIKEEKVGKEFKDVIYLTAPNKDLKGNIITE